MNIDFFSFDGVHPLGYSATHPIEPLATRLGALLRLAACRTYKSFQNNNLRFQKDEYLRKLLK